ncbi:MAG TPA: enoyl-CoA hydratase/isomerase family protein, partial [Burkholderiaceae bacterium]|nr:enoyl-CoA hydratase/isomerase family protein [Burkholderiaceae bacterium]
MAAPVPCAGTDLQAQLRGRVGVLTLNRPGALNALTLAMVRDLAAWLLHWQHDDAVVAVVLRGATLESRPRAFCAGGDVRFMR